MWMPMTGGEAERPFEKSTLKQQLFVIISCPLLSVQQRYVESEVDIFSCISEAKSSAAEIKEYKTCKIRAELGNYLERQCSIWQTRLGWGSWPWPALCFCCLLVLIESPGMDADPAVALDCLLPFLSSVVVLQDHLLSWTENSLRISSNLYWSLTFSYISHLHNRDIKTAKTLIDVDLICIK